MIDLNKRGIRTINDRDYQMLCDVKNLIALACRRFDNPFNERELQLKIQNLYREMAEFMETRVPFSQFDSEEPTQTYPDNVILLSDIRKKTGK